VAISFFNTGIATSQTTLLAMTDTRFTEFFGQFVQFAFDFQRTIIANPLQDKGLVNFY